MAAGNIRSKWFVYAKRGDFDGISRRFGVDPVVARILRNRDIISDDDISLCLYGDLSDIYDESLMPDMQKCADAIYAAVKNHEHIRIVGDYDIDGVCATYILEDALLKIGAKVDHFIPDRIEDGYGINVNIVRKAAKDKVDLILTCDNGITAIDEMKLASKLGLKVVITDHHSVLKDENGQDILPEALAVVDVKREGSLYPDTECCGAVTAWKLIRRVFELAGVDQMEWLGYLDVAALATVGDIMRLRGENRIIVREGLKYINYWLGQEKQVSSSLACTGDTPVSDEDMLKGGLNPHPKKAGAWRDFFKKTPINPGLKTLLCELGLGDKKIDTYHIGFVIGPCINASGRLESAEKALRLLLTKETKEALMLSRHLKELNLTRQSMTEAGVKRGIELAQKEFSDSKVLVIYLSDLHESLAGIVAGRIKEYTGKPCICITRAKEGLKGSGRSIESYDMFARLCEADSFLSRYGGHKMAAGMSLPAENLKPFREFLNSHADLSDEDLVKKVWIDVPMPLSYVSIQLIDQIDSLSPFGNGFERPIFADKHLTVLSTKVLGKNQNVLRVVMRSPDGRVFDGIMFGEAPKYAAEITGQLINILYVPVINDFRGQKSIEFQIKDYTLLQQP